MPTGNQMLLAYRTCIALLAVCLAFGVIVYPIAYFHLRTLKMASDARVEEQRIELERAKIQAFAYGGPPGQDLGNGEHSPRGADIKDDPKAAPGSRPTGESLFTLINSLRDAGKITPDAADQLKSSVSQSMSEAGKTIVTDMFKTVSDRVAEDVGAWAIDHQVSPGDTAALDHSIRNAFLEASVHVADQAATTLIARIAGVAGVAEATAKKLPDIARDFSHFAFDAGATAAKKYLEGKPKAPADAHPPGASIVMNCFGLPQRPPGTLPTKDPSKPSLQCKGSSSRNR